MSDKIVLRSVFVPWIFAWAKVDPGSKMSWIAFHECDDGSPWTYGWGATREQALANLKWMDERAEAEDRE